MLVDPGHLLTGRTQLKRAKAVLTGILVTAGLVLLHHITVSAAAKPADPTEAADLAAFAKLAPIDTHAHVFQDSPEFYHMLERLNMHIVNIDVVDQHGQPFERMPFSHQFQINLTVHRHSGGRAAICTSFDPYSFNQPGFAQQVIRQLNQNFREGAVAVKIWKNIGMELKWPSGKYVLPDDPIFEPIYKDIAAHHKTMIAHLAEPDVAWKPFPKIAGNPDYNYYRHNPFWHMVDKPGAPSKAQILAARDHLVAENPGLRVVGAHLGSMETDVNQVAQRLDRYPNFAVDTAARVRYLMAQPRDKVRAFLIKYQDRVLYGTDDGISPTANATEEIKSWEEELAMQWKYFATDETFEYEGLKVHGLKLPPEVLRKLYHENAVRWIPGVLGVGK